MPNVIGKAMKLAKLSFTPRYIVAAASLYGLSHERAEDVSGFRAALERALARQNSSIVEVRGDRAANVQLHRRVWGAVSAAIASA